MLETLVREENQEAAVQLNHDGLLEKTRMRGLQESATQKDEDRERNRGPCKTGPT